ncbi:MAG: hypothetical protein PF448_06265 [Bacteroidales bacterium]|jgi:hypothetical protein|nr:hypothetical protein [Bacteroidales bacterium]
MEKQDVKVGAKAIYYPVILPDGSKPSRFRTTILSEPRETSNGLLVCKIAGISGAVSIKHLELRQKKSGSNELPGS